MKFFVRSLATTSFWRYALFSLDALGAILAAVGVQSGTIPTYPKGPHCNTRGLTDLGKHVVKRGGGILSMPVRVVVQLGLSFW